MATGKKKKQRQLGLHPTVFIGIGGSGCKTVTELRKIITSSDENKVFKKMVEYLKIDSRVEPDIGVKIVGRDYQGMAPPLFGDEMVNSLAGHADESISQQFPKWWRRDEKTGDYAVRRTSFAEGAGQVRENGRLVFAHYEGSQATQKIKIKSRLTGIKNTFANKNHDFNSECARNNMAFYETPDIIIIAGLGGGTGSAIALDIAVLVRSIFTNARTVVLYGFLQDIVTLTEKNLSATLIEMMRQNVIHAIAEIEYWQQPARADSTREPYSMYWNADSPTPTTFNHTNPPFDAVHLIGGKMEGGAQFSKGETYYKTVADFLGRFYGRDESAKFLSESINHAIVAIENDEKPDLSLRYGRIGIHRIVFPTSEVTRYFSYKTINESLERGFLHRHSKQKQSVREKEKDKIDERGLPVYKGVIELEWSKTLTETGLDRWQQMVLIVYDLEGKNEKLLDKCPELSKTTEEKIIKATSFATFGKEIRDQKAKIDKIYEAVQGGEKAAKQSSLFDRAVQSRLESFCSWKDRGQISIRNMRCYLDMLHATCTIALDETQTLASRALEEVTSNNLPGKVCSEKWLENQAPLFKKKLLGMLQKKESLGRAAKEAAISWLKETNRLKYEHAAHMARKEWLQQCLTILEEWSTALAAIEPVYIRIQEECTEQMARAEKALQNRPGAQTNVIDSLEMLKQFRPEWFQEYSKDPESKDQLYEIFQRGISGQVDDMPGFEKNGQGLWRHMLEIRTQNRTGGPSADKEVQNQVESWVRELKGIITALAQRQWEEEIGSIPIWDVILWKVKENQETTDIFTDEGVEKLKSSLYKELRVYETNIRRFSEINKTKMDTTPTALQSNWTIAYSISEARTALTNAFGESTEFFNPDTFLSDLLPDWTTLDTDENDQLVLISMEHGYAAQVFMGLEELPSYFQAPEDRTETYSWSDIRYAKWFSEALSPLPPAAKWALACLAWCWGGTIGFQDETKGSNYKFSFGTESFKSIYSLFDSLPSSSAWEDLLGAMQNHWNSIPPVKRAEEFKAAQKFVAAKRKGMRNIVSEPARLECLKQVEKVLKKEADMAAEAGRNAEICQHVGKFFIDSARSAAPKDPRPKK